LLVCIGKPLQQKVKDFVMAKTKMHLHICVVFLVCSVGLGCAPSSSRFVGAARGPEFIVLAKELQPTVVNVSATLGGPATLPSGQGRPGAPEGEMTERFFGVPRPPAPVPQRSQGSGFIIGSDGTILTNAHVVEGAKKITVRLHDKREFEARVVGRDLRTDVAVIRIGVTEKLPTIKLGDSDNLEVGEWVMAVGNPFGLDNSVSSGIVSAKGRHIGEAYDRLIQTDAPINPGSSGGPLVNLDGRVIGINKAIVSQMGGGSIGISFATPINLIKEILPQLQSNGKVTRGWAGVAIQEITPVLAEILGLGKTTGALVAAIAKGGPADRSGMKVGDVITEYDGKKVTDALDLPLLIARTPIAKQVPVTIHREKQELRLALIVAELPERPMQMQRDEIG
jgi:serine protease Do